MNAGSLNAETAHASASLALLRRRNSAAKLTAPAPSPGEVREMLGCALRSPDHARLRPWRFLSVRGERREALGELMLESLLRREPGADDAARAKARGAPLRAPLLMVVFAVLAEHPKVPAWEQRLSAGCAAFSLELAAEALGYAAIWRTGPYAEDRELARALGGGEAEEIVGFIYLGTRDGAAKPLPDLDPADFHREW
ncbi:MAG: nitroreductase [Halieaceae bacterium]|jgi:nitroreductase|nr:nitroreductase [Halieaceae bacterium]